MAFAQIEYAVERGVARIVLNRPDRLNALGIGPGSNREEIVAALAMAAADPAVGCVLLSAAGRAFSAGGDLRGLPPMDEPLDDYRFGLAVDRFHAEVRACPKPVIAAVHGLCLGAALGLVAQCDFVLAADDARFGLVEGRVGYPGAAELVALVGVAWAKYLILTGETVNARQARRMGLVLAVLPAAALAERAFDLAGRLARMPRAAVQFNKAAVNAVGEALGRANARLVARPHETLTKLQAPLARAPDGRRFADVLRSEGMAGLKAARGLQYDTPWLDEDDT